MPTLFSLNVNKIALLRNSRGTNYPHLESYVRQAINLGVRSITVHPRPDERHIRFNDLPEIKKIVEQESGLELNVEGYPSDSFIDLVNEICPHQITLVPDNESQLTSDHGWNLNESESFLRTSIDKIKTIHSRICLFWDPCPDGLDRLKSMNVSGIELYTEPFVQAHIKENYKDVLEKYRLVFDRAKSLGMRVNAGHDLSQSNLKVFLDHCPVDEVSIGHAFIVEALDFGFKYAVKNYLEICEK